MPSVHRFTFVAVLAGMVGPGPAAAQQGPPQLLAIVCGSPVPQPEALPPAGSSPVLLALALCFDRQGGNSLIDPETYLHYIRPRPSDPAHGRWIRYDEQLETQLLDDFKRLWGTKFLDDLSIEVKEYPLANGVIAKAVIFNIEERQRVRIVDYAGLSHVDRADLEKALKERGADIGLDSFLDRGVLRQVASVILDLLTDKGYRFAEVKPTVTEIAGGPKLVNVTFKVAEGPKVAIRDIEFLGNRQVPDTTLAKALKVNRAQGLLSAVNGTGVYRERQFDEDADRIVAAYRDLGYITARLGQPDPRPLEESADGQTRWVQLRIPVDEGKRYRIGEVSFEGNTRVDSTALATLFNLRRGAFYSEAAVRKGLEKAREVYGAGGYYEFTAYPDLQPDSSGSEEPVVDVKIKVAEGPQYFVNRITFSGNTHTRDEVVRRELALVEAGVFNTEALKVSLRRLNQLGYFKPLDDKSISVNKASGAANKVDIELKVEEQNRNQISFGAGASQYDGIFGNLSFSTSNFIGRGEALTLSAQKGARSGFYQAAFTEPFLFGRPITAGANLFSRKIDYQIYSTAVDYSEVRSGGSVTTGLALRRFTRLLLTYGYEVIATASSDAFAEAFTGTSAVGAAFLDEGRHVQSSMTPSFVYNTVDSPYVPRQGMRLTASYQYAGGPLGGTTNFAKPELEAIAYLPVSRRTALGMRASTGWLLNYSSTALPYYLRYFLGGETQVRGTELRSVGPMNANGAAIGGNKFLLFNAEYYYDIAPMVRGLLFHDAGQAFAEDQPLDVRQLRTSSGVELRVTVPMLGVPFRLIYAWNTYRDVSQPARTFKFGVGMTF
jgi:outer membrane protein insertion porin family